MKALELKKVGHLIYRDDKEKPIIKENEILIYVKAVGVCGSDFQRVFNSGAHKMPIILGHEFSGIVVNIGKSISNFNIGDRVVAAPLIPCNTCEWCNKNEFSLCEKYDYIGSRRNGAMTEFVAVPEGNLLPLPENVSFEEGAMVEPAANAIHGLWIGEVTEKDVVCILGAGPIGILAVQFAKAIGVKKIICVDLDDTKLSIAKKVGADETVNTLKENLKLRISELTSARGVDLVLEATGAPVLQNTAVEILCKTGRLVLLGFSHQDVTFQADIFESILRKQLKIYGSWNSFSEQFPGNEWRYTLRLMSEGKIKVDEIISHRLELHEGPDFFENVKSRKEKHNKVMFFNK